MNSIPRCIAVIPECKQVPQYITTCQLIVTMMTGNTAFPDPTPPLSEVSAQLDILEASEQSARKGGKGATQKRNVDRQAVHSAMQQLKAYVQRKADASGSEAESTIKSAGMDIKKKSTRTKLPLAVRQGKTSGSVIVEAKALPRPVQYRWQMSADQASWTDLQEGFKAAITVEGLTPVKVYSFRLRTMTKNGLSDWSAAASIIAH